MNRTWAQEANRKVPIESMSPISPAHSPSASPRPTPPVQRPTTGEAIADSRPLNQTAPAHGGGSLIERFRFARSLGPRSSVSTQPQGSEQTSEALRHAQEALKDADTQRMEGKLETAEVTYTAAINNFNRSYPNNQSMPADVKIGLAKAYCGHGMTLSMSGRFDEGRKDFEMAVGLGSKKATSILSIIPYGSASTTVPNHFNSQQASPLSFTENRAVKLTHDIKHTRHLAESWLAASKVEQRSFRELAVKILHAANLKGPDKLAHSQEIAPLAAIPDRTIFKEWIDIMFSALSGKTTLNQQALRGLEVMLHKLPQSLLNTEEAESYLVKLLEALNENLNIRPWVNVEALQLLLQTISQLLDKLVWTRLQYGVNRINLRDKLNNSLIKLKNELKNKLKDDYSVLEFQINYVRQALELIPNEESPLEEFCDRLFNGFMLITNVYAAVASISKDVTGLQYAMNAALTNKTMSQASVALSQRASVTSIAAGIGSGAKSGMPAIKDLAEAMFQVWRSRVVSRPWLMALQLADACFVGQGQFFEFERFVRWGPYGNDKNFLQGLCQRLEYIAGRYYSEAERLRVLPASQVANTVRQTEVIARQAVKFLSIFTMEGQPEPVQKAALNALKRLDVKLPKLLQDNQDFLKLVRPDSMSAQQAGLRPIDIPPAWHTDWYTPPTSLLEKQLDGVSWPDLNRKIQQFGKTYLETRHLKTLKKTVKDNIQDIDILVKKYIEPKFTRIDDVSARSPLAFSDTVTEFLGHSKQKFLLLLGDAGAGKTIFNHYLTRDLWEKYNESIQLDDDSSFIPLFIHLPDLGPTFGSQPNNFIVEYFENQGLKASQIQFLQKTRNFIFILDGYDELGYIPREFYKYNELDKWEHSKTIISSRPEYLDYNHKRHFGLSGIPEIFQEYRFAPFSEVDVKNYIKEYIGEEILEEGVNNKKYKNENEIFNSLSLELKELVRNPFLLNIALHFIPLDESKTLNAGQRHFTRFELYNRFVDSWCDRSYEHLIKNKKSEKQLAFDILSKKFDKNVVCFAKKFAVAMHRKQQKKVVTTEYKISTQEHDWSEELLKKLLDDGNVKNRLLLQSAPLIDLYDKYEFIHKSFQDYFVAYALWDGLSTIDQSAWINKLSVVKDPAVLDFLVELVQQDRGLIGQLIAWIKASKNEVFKTAAANALTILVRARVLLSGENFNQIHAPGADLSYGVFDHTKFEKADLRRAKLRGAWLREADFNGAKLADIEFGEKPALEFNEHVKACSLSSDGRWLAVGTGSLIRLYQAESLRRKKTFDRHFGDVVSVSLSSDGKLLASGDDKGMVKVRQFKDGGWLSHNLSESHSDKRTHVSLSSDGNWLASWNTGGRVKVWQFESGSWSSHDLPEEHDNKVVSVSLLPFGESLLLAAGCRDGKVEVWGLENEGAGWSLRVSPEGHDRDYAVESVSLSSDRKLFLLASVDTSRVVKLWQFERVAWSPYVIPEGHDSNVMNASLSSDGKWLALGNGNGTVTVWDVGSAKMSLRETLEWHGGRVNSVSLSLDGKRLASGGSDKTVKLWELESAGASLRDPLERHHGVVSSVSLSSDGNWLASGSWGGTVNVWKFESGRENWPLSKTLVRYGGEMGGTSVSLSSDGTRLASGNINGKVEVWQLERGSTDWLWHKAFEGGTIFNSVSFSSDGQRLALVRGRGIANVWQFEGDSWVSVPLLPDRNLVALRTEGMVTIRRLSDDKVVKNVSLSSDGNWLASRTMDGMVNMQRLGSEPTISPLGSPFIWGSGSTLSNVSLSSDGKRLALGSVNGSVWYFEGENWSKLKILEEHSDLVTSVSLSPDGQWLVSGSRDGTVKLWSVDSEKCEATIQNSIGKVTSVAWQGLSVDSAKIATGGTDGTVRIWQVDHKENDRRFILSWTSCQNRLTVAGMSIEGIEDLSPTNARLLKQRGAHDGA